MRGRFLFCLSLTGILFTCTPKSEKNVNAANRIEFTVQRTLPHDTKAFTQGLLIHQGQLYESTGQEESWIGIVDIATGIAKRRVELDKKYFGEGIAILNSKVFQITWRDKTGFIYRFPSFEKIGEFTYTGEGWGLATDGKNLIMSNGTEEISFLDTVTLKPVRTLSIKHQGEAVTNLNELEYVDGFLYANIWQTDLIAQIDIVTGEVKGFLDLSILTQRARAVNPKIDVLNGIAWHPATKTMLVTGKFWPFIFILKLKEQKQSPSTP